MQQLKLAASLFIIIAAILWALDGVVLRPNLYSLPVPTVVFVEHGLAFLVMVPFLIRELFQFKKLKAGDWGAFLWVAVFGGAFGTMFITKALFYVNFVNLSIVVLIQKLQPVFALTLAAIILKEKLPKKFWLWAAVALVATYFVTFANFVPNLSTGDKTAMAALFALGAAFSWGSSTVFSKRALRKVSFQLGTYLRFGLTTVLIFLIVFSSGGAAMLLYYYGLKKVSASVSSICELAFPLAAILFEFILRGRMLNWSQWLGALVLFFAIYKISLLPKDLN